MGDQSGSAFLFNSIDLTDAASFSALFSFRIHDPGNGGADGLAFVIQPNNNTAGSAGGGIGFQGIENSLAIEFDTWHNGSSPACDINENHVGINLGGLICSEVQTSLYGLGILQDGDVWYVWVDYDAVNELLEVRVSLGTTRPTDAFISLDGLVLEDVLGGTTDAYVGFTAATGGANATHDIVVWQFIDVFDPIVVPLPAPDSDQDGVSDIVDNCENDSNADQADFDSDGIGDACDPDNDNDGVDDVDDNCQFVYNSGQTDSDGDGVGDACDNAPNDSNPDQADADGDGVGDVADNCVNDPNPDQSDRNGDGVGDTCTGGGGGGGSGGGGSGDGSKGDILNDCKQGGHAGRDKAPGQKGEFNEKGKAAESVCKDSEDDE